MKTASIVERLEEHINVVYGGPAPFADRVIDLVEKVDDEQIPGEKKRKAVLDTVAKEADIAMLWPKTPAGMAAELVDGPVIRAVLGFMVEVAVRVVKRRKARKAAESTLPPEV